MVLDEVGLAEDSPSLPLKTLHPLLEDGTARSHDVSVVHVCVRMFSYLEYTVDLGY